MVMHAIQPAVQPAAKTAASGGPAARIIPFPSEFPDRGGHPERGATPTRQTCPLAVHARPAPPPRGFFGRPSPSIGFFTARTGSLGVFARAQQPAGFWRR